MALWSKLTVALMRMSSVPSNRGENVDRTQNFIWICVGLLSVGHEDSMNFAERTAANLYLDYHGYYQFETSTFSKKHNFI